MLVQSRLGSPPLLYPLGLGLGGRGTSFFGWSLGGRNTQVPTLGCDYFVDNGRRPQVLDIWGLRSTSRGPSGEAVGAGGGGQNLKIYDFDKSSGTLPSSVPVYLANSWLHSRGRGARGAGLVEFNVKQWWFQAGNRASGPDFGRSVAPKSSPEGRLYGPDHFLAT